MAGQWGMIGMWCGSDQARGRPLGDGGPLNSHLIPIGRASGEECARQGQEKVSGYEETGEMQRMVAKMMEGVEVLRR